MINNHMFDTILLFDDGLKFIHSNSALLKVIHNRLINMSHDETNRDNVKYYYMNIFSTPKL